MAGNTINMNLNVQDQGGTLKARTSEAKDLNKELERAEKLAGRTFAAQSSERAAGGTAGFAMNEGQYARARGVAGSTGAEARDFAAQSQSLGGLVRLYATWAANIYAAGAAFNALREAANVTNMISGMNQLGTASGVALGSMAKQFADASGGAISLQEAISATVKATSSGLSQTQFKQLGEVANKASRALGINMSDAVSRLTRGITKLEPELLDELGIFTKVGQSSEAYAKSIGKSASSLSDFEKRQAFANAVLEEGLSKFDDIDVDANPYDRLAASLTNLQQTALAAVNTVLGPLISTLSSSPTALTGIIAGFSLMILKQAIPAVAQYRDALKTSAEESEERWQARSAQMIKMEQDRYKYLLVEASKDADNRVDLVQEAEERIASIRNKAKLKSSPFDERVKEIVGKTEFRDVRAEDIRYLKDAAEYERKRADGNKELAGSYEEARVALLKWIAAERSYAGLEKKIQTQVQTEFAQASAISPQGRARDRAEAGRQRSTAAGLVSQAANTANLKTMREAFEELGQGITNARLEGVPRIFARIGGGAAILATSIGRITAVAAGFLGQIGLIVSGLTILYGWVSSNRDAAEKLGSALSGAEETVKTSTATFEKFKGVISAEELMATSNAMSGLAANISQVSSATIKMNESSNWLDNLWEWTKGRIGMSQQDASAEVIADSITNMLKNMDTGEAKAAFEAKLREILKVKTLNKANIEDVVEGGAFAKGGGFEKLKKAADEQEIKFKAVNNAVTAVMNSFKGVNSAFRDLSNSFTQSDPLTKYALSLGEASKDMVEAFKEPGVAARTYAEIAKDATKLTGFPEEARAELLAGSQEYVRLSTQAENYKNRLEEIDAELKKLGKTGLAEFKIPLLQERAKIKVDLDINQSSLNNLTAAAAPKLASLAQKSLSEAFKLLSQKEDFAAKQVGVDVAKARLSALPESPETIRAQMQLENQSINIRKQEIEALYKLTTQLQITSKKEELDRVTEKLEKAKPEDRPGLESQQTKLKSDITGLTLLRDKGAGAFKAAGAEVQSYDTLQALAQRQGMESQLTQLSGQQRVNEINARIRSYSKGLELQDEQLQRFVKEQKALFDKKLATENLSTEDATKAERDYLEATAEARRKLATTAERRNKEVLEMAAREFRGTEEGRLATQMLEDKVGPNGVVERQGYRSILLQAERTYGAEEATAQANRGREQAEQKINALISSRTILLEGETERQQISAQTELERLNYTRDTLQQQITNSGIMSIADADRLKSIELQILSQEKAIALSDAEASSKKKLLDLEIRLQNAKELGLTPEAVSDLRAQVANETSAQKLRLQQINELYAGREKLRLQQIDEQTRLSAYTTAFTNAFKSMEDAVVEFAKTGELSFKSMINSFLEDLLRFELRRMQATLFQGVGGAPGLANSLMQAFGGPSGVVSVPAVSGGDFTAAMQSAVESGWVYPSAKGSYYDGSVAKFAKGGTFTNSVVNSPTLFKFAKGAGLMGEAGPEAIMPLKRDANGNLGVRSTPSESKVEVVVNNYSGEPAQAIETRDSRGNRKVEIVVGELTAAEMARSGSASQQSVSKTFGLRPTLIRR